METFNTQSRGIIRNTAQILVFSVIVSLCFFSAVAQNSFAQQVFQPNTSIVTRPTPIYLSFNSHNEENDYLNGTSSTSSAQAGSQITMVKSGQSYENQQTFLTLRTLVKQMADVVRSGGAKWNWQSDWRFLKGVQNFDPQDFTTDRKNIVRWLVENNGGAIEVDPHAHETIYNYADVEYLFRQVGVVPSPVVGGFTYNANQAVTSTNAGYRWDVFASSTGLQGNMFPTHYWKPQVLYGGASGANGRTNHNNDVNTLGVWKPKSFDEFFVHSTAAALTLIGNGPAIVMTDASTPEQIISSIATIITSLSTGALPRGKMYSVCIGLHQKYFTSTSYASNVAAVISGLQRYVTSGQIIWATHLEKIAAWQSNYASEPNFYPHTGTTASITTAPTLPVVTLPTVTVTLPTITAPTLTARVYPNPANAVANIQLTGTLQSAQMDILSATGTVMTSQMIIASTTVDVSGYANGLYYVLLRSGSAAQTVQLRVFH